MPIHVICPNCKEQNYGSALYCTKCQTSLIGIPREGISDLEGEDIGSANSTEKVYIEQGGETIIKSRSTIVSENSVMIHDIASWTRGLLILGGLHLITSDFLSAPYGILLIIVGLGSFLFPSASMFIIYAVTLGWAALSNLLSLEPIWIAFALAQFYLAFAVFRKYFRYRNIESDYRKIAQSDPVLEQIKSDRANRFFPWLGFTFGCSSILVLVLMIVIGIIMLIGSEGIATLPEYFSFIESLLLNFGVLGASIALASLLSKYRYKALSILGLLGGISIILFELISSLKQ